jgi:hypothetical protein
MKRLLVAIALILAFQGNVLADLLRPGLWKNDKGSTLQITSVSPNGTVRGVFTNHAQGFGCQGIPYPANGKTSMVLTTFRVNFTACQTVTTWQGTVAWYGFPTTWLLVHQGRTQTGSDFFYRVN